MMFLYLIYEFRAKSSKQEIVTSKQIELTSRDDYQYWDHPEWLCDRIKTTLMESLSLDDHYKASVQFIEKVMSADRILDEARLQINNNI